MLTQPTVILWTTGVAVTLFCLICDGTSSTEELLQRQYLALAPSGSLDRDPSPSLPRVLPLTTARCRVRCKSDKRRSFCASDGRTYGSKCDIRKARKCLGLDLKIVSRGPCGAATLPTGPQDKTGSPAARLPSCAEERQRLIRERREETVHIPECYSNGSYKETQCFSGWCWCVSEDGHPISKTSTKGTKPVCKGRQPVTRKSRRGASRKCRRDQKEEFNTNVIEELAKEYRRGHNDSSLQGETQDSMERLIISWKFESLDRNSNDRLSSRELRDLRRLIRKHLKPRRCAKRFHKYCDKDGDKELSRVEWMLCFGQNHAIRSHRTRSPSSGGWGRSERQTSTRPLYPLLNAPPRHRSSENKRRGPLLNPGSTRPIISEPEQDGQQDCPTERARAMRMHNQNPEAQVFVPMCTQGGLFNKAQCHTATGYCWCVEQQTGQPIPGHSTKDRIPNCEDARPRRNIRGCPYKRQFVTLVMDRLAMEMVEFASLNPNTELISMDPEFTIEERVARYKFRTLDQNNNQKLERRESRAFKEFLKVLVKEEGEKDLRKCARNFVRYCDVDDSGKIGLQEWIDCLTAPKNGVLENPCLTCDVEGRALGENPLDHLLE